MTSRTKYFTTLSVLAGAFAVLLVLTGYGEDNEPHPLERWLAGGAFMASCAVGVSLSLRPNWLRRRACHGEDQPDDASEGGEGPVEARPRVGHHPACPPFAGHVICADGGRCAGCTGLAVGAIVAAVMAVPLVMLPGTSPGVEAALPVLALGLTLVAAGLASGIAWPGGAWGHLALNALLAPGFLLVVAAVLVGTGDVMRSIVALLLCYLWLDARIELAGWNHARVCTACPEDCKAYRL